MLCDFKLSSISLHLWPIIVYCHMVNEINETVKLIMIFRRVVFVPRLWLYCFSTVATCSTSFDRVVQHLPET